MFCTRDTSNPNASGARVHPSLFGKAPIRERSTVGASLTARRRLDREIAVKFSFGSDVRVSYRVSSFLESMKTELTKCDFKLNEFHLVLVQSSVQPFHCDESPCAFHVLLLPDGRQTMLSFSVTVAEYQGFLHPPAKFKRINDGSQNPEASTRTV